MSSLPSGKGAALEESKEKLEAALVAAKNELKLHAEEEAAAKKEEKREQKELAEAEAVAKKAEKKEIRDLKEAERKDEKRTRSSTVSGVSTGNLALSMLEPVSKSNDSKRENEPQSPRAEPQSPGAGEKLTKDQEKAKKKADRTSTLSIGSSKSITGIKSRAISAFLTINRLSR
jgi:hypothetical protein